MENLSRKIIELDPNAGILLVGSVSKGIIDGLHDLDLLVVGNDEIILALRQEADYKDTCDGSLRFAPPGKPEVGILVKSLRDVKDSIDAILEGSLDLKYKAWAIGAEAPEGFLGDIADAKILYEGEGSLDDEQRPGWLGKAFKWIWPF